MSSYFFSQAKEYNLYLVLKILNKLNSSSFLTPLILNNFILTLNLKETKVFFLEASGCSLYYNVRQKLKKLKV